MLALTMNKSYSCGRTDCVLYCPRFVSRAIVTNLREGEEYYFICRQWLAVDIGDGLLDRTFKVATPQDMKGFSHLFTSRATL